MRSSWKQAFATTDLYLPGPHRLFEDFEGTDGADTYFGTDQADTIHGYGGSDTLLGGGGDDVIDGGEGNDQIAGDAGDDRLNGGVGDDAISSSSGADTVDGGDGYDTWIGSYADATGRLNFVQAHGRVSNGTTLAGIEAIDLTTGNGNDRFRMDTTAGWAIHANGGIDALTFDLADGTSKGHKVKISPLQDISTIETKVSGIPKSFEASGVERYEFKGGAGDDVFTLKLRNDSGISVSMYGEDGNDQFITNGSKVKIIGGSGFDLWRAQVFGGVTYDQASQTFSDGSSAQQIESVSVVSNSTPGSNQFNLTNLTPFSLASFVDDDRVNIDLSSETQGLTFTAVVSSFTFGASSLKFYSGLALPPISLIATSGNDTFNISAAALFTSIDGGSGSDLLELTVNSPASFVVQDDGTIVSSVGSFANMETFHLTLQGQDNTVTTGDADDVVTVTSFASGVDTILGGEGDDLLSSDKGDDFLKGEEGADTLNGGDGDDTLNGGSGDDMLDGGAGSDTAGYSDAAAGVTVTLVGGPQDTKGDGVDTLTSIENLNGSKFGDTLTGNFGDNVLRGNDGDDRLTGLDGADVLDGGGGADLMTGGAGADRFVFRSLTVFGRGTLDQVLDFSHAQGDRIDLSEIDPEKGGTDQKFTFIGGNAFTGSAGVFELRAEAQGGGKMLVQGDVNHDGAADFAFVVTTGTTLVAADFNL